MAFRYGWKTFDSGANRDWAYRLYGSPTARGGSVCTAPPAFPWPWRGGHLRPRVAGAHRFGHRGRGESARGQFLRRRLYQSIAASGVGRAQETYGEDPYHLGKMGVAAIKGAQRHLMACVKHFACNSIEESRFYVDVRVDERTLRRSTCPTSANARGSGLVDECAIIGSMGSTAASNSHLLRDILKEEWGFDGFVMSDFVWGLREPGQRGCAAGWTWRCPGNGGTAVASGARSREARRTSGLSTKQ